MTRREARRHIHKPGLQSSYFFYSFFAAEILNSNGVRGRGRGSSAGG